MSAHAHAIENVPVIDATDSASSRLTRGESPGVLLAESLDAGQEGVRVAVTLLAGVTVLRLRKVVQDSVQSRDDIFERDAGLQKRFDLADQRPDRLSETRVDLSNLRC